MKQYNNIKDKNKKWIEFKVISKRKEIKAKKKKKSTQHRWANTHGL
jgi:hypothetical protein